MLPWICCLMKAHNFHNKASSRSWSSGSDKMFESNLFLPCLRRDIINVIKHKGKSPGSRRICKVIWIHPQGTMNVWTRFHGNSSSFAPSTDKLRQFAGLTFYGMIKSRGQRMCHRGACARLTDVWMWCCVCVITGHSMAETLTVALRVAEEAIEEAIAKAEEFGDSLVRIPLFFFLSFLPPPPVLCHCLFPSCQSQWDGVVVLAPTPSW